MKSMANENLNTDTSSSTSATKLTSLTEKFIKYYNKVVDDNASYNDDGLKSLEKK